MAKVPQNPTNLWLRHRTWFLRLSIPPSLRQHFGGKDKIVESLGTADLNVAIAERDRRVDDYHAQFERLRTSTTTTNAVYVQARREEPRFPAGFSGRLGPYCDIFTILHLVGDTLEDVRKLLGIPPEEFKPGSPRWMQLGSEALYQKLVAAGVHNRPEDMIAFFCQAASKGETAPAGSTPVPVILTARSDPNGERFSGAFEAFLKDIKSDNPATIDEYKRKAKLFEDYCRNSPLSQITRATAADFLDKFLLEERNVSKRTRNLYASLLHSVFKSAIRRGRFTAASPFEAQKLKVDEEHYEPFTTEEISKLFEKATFVTRPNKHTVHTALPWVMLIGAYTGARLEEIAQLRVADIQEREGVWFFDIHNGNGNSLKNKSAPRCVPIHSQLIAAGLLDYVAGLQKDSRLFPALKPRKSKNNKVGAELSDEFLDWRRRVGVVRESVNFHSFRHTVTNMFEKLGVPDTDAARVLGHKIKGLTYRVYSHEGPGLHRLQAIVEKISYAGWPGAASQARG
jgi:integrase